jgi:hypothetical protein
MKAEKDYHDLPRAELLKRAEEALAGYPPEIHAGVTLQVYLPSLR